MWFSECPPVFTLFNRLCLPANGILVPPNGILVLVRSKPIAKFQRFVQVVLEKAKSSYNRQKKPPSVVF